LTAEIPSVVLLQQPSTPPFKVSQNAATIVVTTSKMKAIFDRQTGVLHFADQSGNAFLSEVPGSRRLDQTTVQGETTFAAEQDLYLLRASICSEAESFKMGILTFEIFPAV